MSGPDRGQRFYRGATRGLSLIFVAIGVLVIVRTLTYGGGPASLGFVLGLAFIAVGAARLWIGTRTGT